MCKSLGVFVPVTIDNNFYSIPNIVFGNAAATGANSPSMARIAPFPDILSGNC